MDLFPSIASIFVDEEEGVVNFLAFLSNDRAQVAGKYGSKSDKDYRQHPFQRAGQRGKDVIVRPYRLAIRWPDEGDTPYVHLPGKPSMLGSGLGATKRTGSPLTYMEFPKPTTWEGFRYAYGRVLDHLA